MGLIRNTLVVKKMVSTCFPKQEIRRQTVIVKWVFEYTQRKSYPSYVKLNFGGTTIIVLTVFTEPHSVLFYQQQRINFHLILHRA